MQTSTFTTLQKQTFQDFKTYPWNEDQAFQAYIVSTTKDLKANQQAMNSTEPQNLIDQSDIGKINSNTSNDVLQASELLKVKHSYYSRSKQPFGLEEFLAYEKQQQGPPVLESSKDNQKMAYERMDSYDYENDIKYQQSLPASVQAWINQRKDHSDWNKEVIEQEFLKAKAMYYILHVEPVDVAGYLAWKEKNEAKSQSACPFANLWKNKGKVAPQEQTSCASFITAETPDLIGGPAIINLSSPKSKNILTVGRLNELKKAYQDAIKNPKATSIFFTATVAENPTHEILSESTPLRAKDTKVVSCGLAYEETYNLVTASRSSCDLQASQNSLETAYHGISREIHQKGKPMVWFINGKVPHSAVYLYLSDMFVRVITEHTLLDIGVKPGHAPFSSLGFFQSRLSKAPRPLPSGIGLYLALSPPELGLLRAPELLRLGMADVFVPELRLQETIESAKNMAVCPLPDTMKALQITLLSQHVYSGPDRLGVWEREIGDIFGAAKSFDELESSLQKINNKWSKSILEHWKQLPPILPRVMFRLVDKIKDMNSLDIYRIERTVNTQWRHSKDYQKWLKQESSWEEADEKHIASYFSDVQVPNGESMFYEAPKEEVEIPAVCPMSGIKSAAVCPVTGKKGTSDGNGGDEASGCPMSGIRK
ncbi:hypothetical protein F4703DRAFT_1014863 [Phycomyces blakesleeanus]